MEINMEMRNNLIPPRVISDLSFTSELITGNRPSLDRCLKVSYSPLVQDANNRYSGASELTGSFRLFWVNIPTEIQEKLVTIEKIVSPLLSPYEINHGNNILKVEPIIARILCQYETSRPVSFRTSLIIYFFFPTQPSTESQQAFDWNLASRSQQLVISNVTSWVKERAWEDLANKIRVISGQPIKTIARHKFFLSYKRQSKAEVLAEIIANRLSQQRIEVWYDKWEIKAGDSVVGKIEEGFKNSDACLIFLEGKYSLSDWCTKEMNTALTKAIMEGFTVVPILIDNCDKPELLKEIKHVDLREPNAGEFEQKLTEITDAIYKVDLNPYR